MSLGSPLPAASSSLPGTHEACASRSGQLLRPLFGLAPGGVCHAAPVTSSAVRSYRTVSPLPVLPGEPSAVCSLLHFPSPRDARPLAGTLPCGARTFLDTRRCRDPHSPPKSAFSKMPRRGLEPPRRFRHQILSLACLPISAPGPVPKNAPERTRTSTGLRPLDPESSASTNSATGASHPPSAQARGLSYPSSKVRPERFELPAF
jgi:hypothetical protein